MVPELNFAHGSGRLLRSSTAIVFTHSTDDGLLGLFADDRHVDFKELAAYIVAAGFDAPPFVVVDLVDAKAFVFGDIELRAGDELLSGSASSTWHEGSLDLDDVLALGPDIGLSDGQLQLGWVAAQAFQFSTIIEVEADPVVVSPAPNPVAERASATPETIPIPIAPEATASPEPPIEDEWDPLADPEIDLERIGAQELTEDFTPTTFELEPEQPTLVEPPGPSSGDDFVPDDTIDNLSDPTEHGLMPPPPSQIAPPPPPTQSTPVGAPPEPFAPIPPPPSIIPLSEARSAPTIPAPAQFTDSPDPALTRARLRFDDGQVTDIRAGVFVGRHPTKSGLPQNYDSVTIRGEHVSRVHWEFVMEDDFAIVRDLGSNSGTEVEINGGRVRVPDGGMRVSPGAKVCFADRWAIYETE